ncbi:MAG TPA: hypothetical protein VM689_08025 [Aliidongia sp.]|nr:hypothetical protein [Aliidongia sp.]
MVWFGTTLPVFAGLTVLLFGGAGWMTGQAMGAHWRPFWHLVPYSLLLAAADRFFDWALFGGDLLPPLGYLLALAVIFCVGAASCRATRARMMVKQYPWLYERAGPFGWRPRN